MWSLKFTNSREHGADTSLEKSLEHGILKERRKPKGEILKCCCAELLQNLLYLSFITSVVDTQKDRMIYIKGPYGYAKGPYGYS